jgi:GT2 family glycosyltransferase
MPKPWFDNRIFEKNGTMVTGIGEDSSWCIKAGETGFKIWLDPNVRVIHNKTMALAWND